MGNFNGFGGGNMQQLMKQAQKMQQDMLRAQNELKDKEFTASSGGGMVTATVKGDKSIVSVKIKPEAVDPSDVEMLEDLIVAAVGEAMNTAEEESARLLGPYAKMLGGV